MVRPQAAAAIAALLLLTACGQKSSPPPPQGQNVILTDAQRQKITLYTVTNGGYRKEVDTSGTVDFDNDQATPVLAPFGGPVTRILVDVGQKVKKGDPLAAVVSPDFATAVSTYRKTLVNAQNLRRLADLDKDLLAHEGVSAKEAEQAEADAASAEADRDAALQSLQSLGVAPEVVKDTEQGQPTARVEGFIRSPIEGTVVEKLINPGQLLQANTTQAFTIADLSKVWVMAHIFDTDVGSVHAGDIADVTGTTRTLAGKVENVGDEVDPNTRSVAVRVVVDNPGGYLKRQMYVDVKIRSGEQSSGLLLPVSAVLMDDENLPFVYAEQSDGSFAREHVTLGYRSGNYYEIPEGIRPGQRIVSDGALFLQFMQQQ
jgi:cobalt-zinc-cadmium efflux system membrane fusion protein